MNTEKIDLVLELLRDFKKDTERRFDEIDKRFEQVDKRFEQIDKRFEQVDKRLDHMETQTENTFSDIKTMIREGKREYERLSDRVEKVYEAREKVKITFGWQWAAASFFIAVLSAGIVGIFA